MPIENTTSQIDDETLGLLSTIHANRHKLDPEGQQLFDTIVQKIGAKNIPGTVAFTAKQRNTRAGRTTVPIRPYSADDFTSPKIGSDISFGDVVGAAGRGLSSIAPALPLDDPTLIIANAATKASGDVTKELTRHGGVPTRAIPRAILRSVPGGDIVANLTAPWEAVATGRAPTKEENLEVVEGTGELGGLEIGRGAASRATPATPAAPKPMVAVEDLPEVQNLTRTIGGGVAIERGVHGPRGTARAGIIFDPKNPAKFVTDHETAINHAALARDQLLAQPEGTFPSIGTKIAMDEINRAAVSTKLSASEAQAITRLRNSIGSKGDLVSPADLHNAVQAGGANIPSSVRRAITPMIDANVQGYRALGEHMGDLYEAKATASDLVNRLSVGPQKTSRVLSGAKAVGNVARGKIGRATGNLADVITGGEQAIDAKALARATKVAAKAATRHATSGGQFSANPSLNALRTITTPEPGAEPLITPPPVERPALPPMDLGPPAQRKLQAPAGPTPRLLAPPEGLPTEGQWIHLAAGDPKLLGPATSPEGPFGRFVDPTRISNPRRLLGSISGPTVQPSASSYGQPLAAPRIIQLPGEIESVRLPGTETITPSGPLQVPERTPITEAPSIDAVGSGVTANDHAAWRASNVPTRTPDPALFGTVQPFAEGDAVTFSGGGIGSVVVSDPETTTVRMGKGNVTARIPTSQLRTRASAIEPAAQVGSSRNPASSVPSRPTPLLIDQSFSKGEPVRYSVGGIQLRGRVVSEVKSSKHGPYVEVSSEPERGKYSILVNNLTRIYPRQ